jgi:hypothetical protein
MGLAPASLIEAQVEQTESFKTEFFGKREYIPVSDEIKEYEDKWREVQLSGPTGKGSAYSSPKITRQI